MILFVGCVASLPMAFFSVADDVLYPTADHIVTVSSPYFQPTGNYTRLHADVVSLDEVNHEATIRVNGYRYCSGDCGATERVVFYEVNRDDATSESIPPSEAVVLPANGAEITSKFTLPIRGSILVYPFDSYELGLGVVIERDDPTGARTVLSPAETRSQLILSVQEQLPRVDLSGVEVLNPAQVSPGRASFEYAYASMLTLQRPAYLRVVVVMVALLSLFVAMFTLMTRPFDQLVINAGALILGVWGARSLVLGGYPVDVTLLDTLLTSIVLFMLLTLTLRGLNYFHRAAGLNLLPWAAARVETTHKCAECLSKIPIQARRCAFCTAPVVTPADVAELKEALADEQTQLPKDRAA